MGRAARRKADARTARQPRQVGIYNPRTGTTETFTVTISDAGLADWIRDRESLATQGYPDRPPDYDTPKGRAWKPTPEELAGGEALDGSELNADNFVIALTTIHPLTGMTAKLLVSRDAEGYLLRSKRVIPGAGVDQRDQRFERWSSVFSAIELTTRLWRVMGFPTPTILTPEDMAKMKAWANEMAAAA